MSQGVAAREEELLTPGALVADVVPPWQEVAVAGEQVWEP